jgi:hypothetical protein
MLVIRDAQFADMARKAVEDFRSGLVKHLLDNYPQSCGAMGGEKGVRAFVQRGIDRAKRHGIEHGGAITILLELFIQFGENFERSPVREVARNILAHPSLPDDAKVGAIRDRHDEHTRGRILVAF